MLNDEDIRKKITQLRKSDGKIYAPLKYFRGLSSLKNVETRYKKMLKKDYKPFKTDKKAETRTSSYTLKFRKKYPGVTKLKDISKVTGIPLRKVATRVPLLNCLCIPLSTLSVNSRWRAYCPVDRLYGVRSPRFIQSSASHPRG